MSLDRDTALVYYGDPVLRSSCRTVVPGEPGLSELVDDLFQAMHKHNGVGLAAPQTGDRRRVLVTAAPGYKRGTGRLALLNPVILDTGGADIPFEEGCLSFPGIYRLVTRPTWAIVRYQDPAGETRVLEDGGLLARIILHEIDHLDGVLFIDHLSFWRRRDVRLRMWLRRMFGLIPNGVIF